VHANHWHFFRNLLDDAHPAYTPEEIERYVEAWSQPGAATGMINYYRSSVRQSPKHAEAQLRPISTPTLVIWGQRDRYLGPELAEPDRADVPNPANRAPLNVDEVTTRPGQTVRDSPAGPTYPSRTRPVLREYGCAPTPSGRSTNG
jgi:pimeloyl-ACP methyl ester carboxylesterase